MLKHRHHQDWWYWNSQRIWVLSHLVFREGYDPHRFGSGHNSLIFLLIPHFGQLESNNKTLALRMLSQQGCYSDLTTSNTSFYFLVCQSWMTKAFTWGQCLEAFRIGLLLRNKVKLVSGLLALPLGPLNFVSSLRKHCMITHSFMLLHLSTVFGTHS